MKKQAKPVIDSRHMKILAAKKDDLKDAVVFVCLDEEKYGHYDMAQLKKLAEWIEKIEPSGCYIIGLKNLRVNIIDRAEVKNRDIVVTVSHGNEAGVDESEVESMFRKAFAEARDIDFVHNYATIS